MVIKSETEKIILSIKYGLQNWGLIWSGLSRLNKFKIYSLYTKSSYLYICRRNNVVSQISLINLDQIWELAGLPNYYMVVYC